LHALEVLEKGRVAHQLPCFVGLRTQIEGNAIHILDLGKKDVDRLAGRKAETLQDFLCPFLAPAIDTRTEEFGFAEPGHGVTNWHISFPDSPSFQGTDDGSSGVGGVRALGDGGDYSLGILGDDNEDAYTALITFQNKTGFAIMEMTLTFDYELWRQLASGDASSMGFIDDDVIGFDSFTVGGNAADAAETGEYISIVGTEVNGSMSEYATFSQTLKGLNIADGAIFGFSFTYDLNGSGPGQTIGIDNFSLVTSTIPEPLTSWLVALAGVVAVVLRRRG
jgi:hypothetical protein